MRPGGDFQTQAISKLPFTLSGKANREAVLPVTRTGGAAYL